MKFLILYTFILCSSTFSKSISKPISKDMNNIAFYYQAEKLHYQCESIKTKPKYSNQQSFISAQNSVVATLQYIGLNISAAAIAQYSKVFEYSDKQYENLYTNLIENDCSKNLSIFSKKGLYQLFKAEYKKDNFSIIPNFNDSLDFQKDVIEILQSKETKLNEFKNTVENFRAFCSWDHLRGDLGLLAPYLSNKYVMTKVFNNILQKKASWNIKNREIIVVPDLDTKRVVCNGLICRASDNTQFYKQFPRMIGASSLQQDLNSMYCETFRHKVLENSKNAKLNSIIKSKNEIQVNSEVMSFLSLITNTPDILNGVNETKDLFNLYNQNINSYWDNWANAKILKNSYSLGYEESLNVDLVPIKNSDIVLLDKLSLTFRYTLGEFDRMFESFDKIDAKFYLDFDSKFLNWYKKQFIQLTNKGKYKGLADLRLNFKERIEIVLKSKGAFFLTNLWNEKFSDIIVDELSNQIVKSKMKFSGLKNQKINIPLNMEFGVFALKYLRDKYKANFVKESILKKK